MKRFAFFLVLCLFVTVPSTSFAADRYQWICSTSLVGYSFDTTTIRFAKNTTSVDKSIIDVWLKYEYTDEGRQSRIKNFPNKDHFQNLSFELSHELWNTNTNQRSIISLAWYDTEGNVIDTFSFSPQSPLSDIIPGSVGEAMMNTLKQYSSANYDSMLSRSN